MEVEGRADVGGQARNKLVRIAADDVDFGAVGKADARPPGPDIEAAVVADREAALDRGFPVRLAEAAEAIVADDGRGPRRTRERRGGNVCVRTCNYGWSKIT